jgi:hypothetical protein
MKVLFRLVALLVAIILAFGAGWVVAKTGMGLAVPEESLPARERAFAERMRGVTLVGRFTIAGRADRATSPDRYDISSVEKIGEGQWRFNARLPNYKTATLPIVVSMAWAGDTPMVTLTDATIPTLGTFTARVFFYGDRYAGTWQHGAVGGHMFGTIGTSTGVPGS